MSILRALLAACVVAALGPSLGIAQVGSFRIETELYHGDEPAPFSKNLTIFKPEAVYDLMLSEPRETTIFDARRGTFVILDEVRKTKTSLTTEELLVASQEMKTQILAGKKDWHYLADPPLQPTFDAAAKTLRLACPQLTYEATCEHAPDQSAARRWRTFAVWYAHLNAARPSGSPPFARLMLNEALYQRELIPTEVRLTISAPGRFTTKTVTMRSKHIVSWRITRSDEDRIDQIETARPNFQEVPYAAFRRLAEVAARAQK
jgi:hypothetical protein